MEKNNEIVYTYLSVNIYIYMCIIIEICFLDGVAIHNCREWQLYLFNVYLQMS